MELDHAVSHNVIEWSVYVFIFFLFRNARKQGWNWTATLIWGAVLGLSLEFLIVRTSAEKGISYTYGTDHVATAGDLLEFFGCADVPAWTQVPIWVGLGWGGILYSATWTAQRLSLPWLLRPFMAGALAVIVDLSLDPVAQYLGFWDWNLIDYKFHFHKVPFDNFVAWFAIVALYSLLVRWLFRCIGRLVPRGTAWNVIACFVPLAALLVEFAVFALARDWVYERYKQASRSGDPSEGEATVFLGILVVFIWLLVKGMQDGRRDLKPNWTILLIVPVFLPLVCLTLFFLSGGAGDVAALLAMIPANIVVGFVAYGWPAIDTIFERSNRKLAKKQRELVIKQLERLKPEDLKPWWRALLPGGRYAPPRRAVATDIATILLTRGSHAELLQGKIRETERERPDLTIVAQAIAYELRNADARIGRWAHAANRMRLEKYAKELMQAGAFAMRFTTRTLTTYSGEKTETFATAPRDRQELREALRFAEQQGWSVAFRGTGHSFDKQSWSDDLVISLEHFTEISVSESEGTITVGAGTKWGDILDAAVCLDRLPQVMVTASSVSAGGTLVTNALSRFSVTRGREGKYVERFQLMHPNGEEITCSRGENAGVFRAVIGGFGYLGAVLQITHRLMPIPVEDMPNGVAVKSDYSRIDGIDDLSRQLAIDDSDQPEIAKRAASVALYLRGANRGLLAISRYVDAAPQSAHTKSLFHTPDSGVHRAVQCFALVSWFRSIGYQILLWSIGNGKTYVDELRGYTFFENGNVWVKSLARRLGIPIGIRQQSYFIPGEPGSPGLGEFLHRADEELDERDLIPSLIDVIYMPPEEPGSDFMFSVNAQCSGFLVTFTFERLLFLRFATVHEFLETMSEHCWSAEDPASRGKVHLVKNVHARRELLSEMYQQDIERLRTLRTADLGVQRRVDTGPPSPGPKLENEFSQRIGLT